MERPCYRCGTHIEEHTTFCPSCGAPQIKVAARGDASGNEPSTAPLPPGTPDSIQPPSVPVKPGSPSRIRWKRFWRFALPLAVVSGATIAAGGLFGIVLLLVSLVVAIAVYRREHPGLLTATQGAGLGAVMGLLASVVLAIFFAGYLSLHFSEQRQQTLQTLQQRLGGNTDPQTQALIHWAGTDRGFLVLSIGSMVLATLFTVLISAAIGALTASVSGSKPR